jgi:Sulfotransferase family
MSTAIKISATVRPTFLFIGADRCGSKSLHNIFRQHPDCFVPSIADPNFFDRNYDRGMEWYLDLFEAAPPAVRAIGEFSHDYIHSAEAASRIAAILPDVKLLATLRHPIERAFSSYASAVSAGVIRAPFAQAIDKVPMLVGNSMYADKLRVYFDFFPRDQIKVLFFDDLEADSALFAKQAFDFLDLPFIDAIDYSQRVSVLSKSRFPLSGSLSKQGANALRKLGWANVLGRLKSNPRFRSLFYKPYESSDKPRIVAETRKRLRDVFAPHIDALETMLGRELSPWRV